ncbi:MAG: hypothetical protein CMM81_00245 [Rhodospirillales bacterium]|jgi:hypothetical protein|nr:hypothetical protein [Rhodospirillales bacterium]|tara:strand:- start:45 stop:245 length:201 start_codon:yes stop_codon:yes gene_type:complete
MMKQLMRRLESLESEAIGDAFYLTTVQPGETEEQAIARQHPGGIPSGDNVIHFMTIYEAKPNATTV